MCDRCNAIERELVTFQRLQAAVEDEFALALMAEVVKDLRTLVLREIDHGPARAAASEPRGVQ